MMGGNEPKTGDWGGSLGPGLKFWNSVCWRVVVGLFGGRGGNELRRGGGMLPLFWPLGGGGGHGNWVERTKGAVSAWRFMDSDRKNNKVCIIISELINNLSLPKPKSNGQINGKSNKVTVQNNPSIIGFRTNIQWKLSVIISLLTLFLENERDTKKQDNDYNNN